MSKAQGETQDAKPEVREEAQPQAAGRPEELTPARGLLALKDHPEVNVEIQSSVYARWSDGEIRECVVVDIRSKGDVTEYCLHIPDCIFTAATPFLPSFAPSHLSPLLTPFPVRASEDTHVIQSDAVHARQKVHFCVHRVNPTFIPLLTNALFLSSSHAVQLRSKQKARCLDET